MAIEVGTDLAQPHYIRRIIDVGIASRDLGAVLKTGGTMLAVAFGGMLCGVGAAVLASLASQKMGADVRAGLFSKVQSLSFGDLDRLRTGNLVTRLTNDVVQVQELVAMFLRIMVRTPLMLIGSVVMAVITSVRLSIIPGILLPVLALVLTIVMRRAYLLFRNVQSGLDQVNTVMQENLAGVRVVKAFVRSRHEEERFGVANNSLMDASISAMRIMAVVMPLSMLVVNLGVVAVVWFGGISVTVGGLTVGGIVAFVNYLLRARMALMMLGMLLGRLSRAMASADRIQEVLEISPELSNPDRPVTPPIRGGRIVFEDVTFSYGGENGDPVLQDISFAVEPGETVAILGSTGSGKSSLVNLVPRFYDVTRGKVTLDGVDVREIDESVLRGRVAVALQDSILFSGTIAENIRYGNPDAGDDEVMAAARAAQAHEFVVATPDGYDSLLGQRGVNLSGGQRQRLAIARALATTPEVLILDDCTSAVDVETEARIQEALAERSENLTTLVVAQRISTVLSADRILVIDDGRLMAAGTHHELMNTSVLYREIYDSQLGEGVVDHV
jgi:ATP-binding cassette subfamily B protein